MKPSFVACVPSLLEDVCNLRDGLDVLSEVQGIIYGGAPPAKSCGNKISKVAALINATGSTEAFSISTLLLTDSHDWEYFEWSPHAGVVMEPLDGDPSVAELVIEKIQGPTYQYVFQNFPDLDQGGPKTSISNIP